MITTVTTVTTVTTIAAVGLTTAITIAAVATLMVLLTTRELAGASSSRFSLRVARYVSVGILPLAITFAAILALKIAEIL